MQKEEKKKSFLFSIFMSLLDTISKSSLVPNLAFNFGFELLRLNIPSPKFDLHPKMGF